MGQAPKTDQEIDDIDRARSDALSNAINAQRKEGRQRTSTVATGGRPVHNACAYPTFYEPSWDLVHEPEADARPAVQQVRAALVKVASGMLLKRRLATRLSAIRAQLASFGSKEDIAAAVKAGFSDDDKASQSSKKDFAGIPDEPALPQFPQEELAAPDPVLTKDITSFDDLAMLPLEVPRHFELMGYQTLPIPAVPAYVTVETSRLLLSGAEEEDLTRGSRPVEVMPACSALSSAPPGAKFSHEPTVVPAAAQEPQHEVPTHCKEPLPFNPVEMVKPPVRVRASSQLLRYPETACDRVLGPVLPKLGITSLEEAVGSNTALALSNLPTMQSTIDATRHQRGRAWFDGGIPALLTGMPEEPKGELVEAEEGWGAAAHVKLCEVPHPYQTGLEKLADDIKTQRVEWSSRLLDNIRTVNNMIENPALKLTYG